MDKLKHHKQCTKDRCHIDCELAAAAEQMLPEFQDNMNIYAPYKLKYLIGLRTGLKGEELVCPREQSSMTPCVCRDGSAAESGGKCVGCQADVEELLKEEEKKHRKPELKEDTDG